jgi:hypothetical protein
MSRLRRIIGVTREERGGVLVLVAVCMSVLIGFTGMVIDVGNWFEHRRHLQTQADAAVLAAAGDVRFPCDASVNSTIAARIEEYGKTRNPQVGGTPPAKVEWALNSRHWPRQPAAPADNTVVEGPPCTAGMIDVKMTEHDLPWFLKATGVVDEINVKARVSMFSLTRMAGALPIGVPDTNPKAMRVWFVDETTSPPAEIADSSKVLKPRKGADGNPVFQNGLQIWDNAADNGGTSLPLKVEHSKIGMRVALSDDASTTDCASSAVKCYDAGSSNGLLFVRGHAKTPTVQKGDAPQVRDAWLLSGTCGDGYYSALNEDCQVQLNARVELAPDVDSKKAAVEAVAGGNTYAMTLDTADGMWKTGAVIPVTSGASVAVGVRVTQKEGSVGGTACTNSKPCEIPTFDDVQRHVSASDARSGPIAQLVVSNAAGSGANSLERCTATQPACTHDLTVRVGLLGSVQYASSAVSPPITLRVAGGSQTGALDCDSAQGFKDELVNGCGPVYEINKSKPCPASLKDTAQPWNCVAVETGGKTNQVPAGLNLRMFGDEKAKTCTQPNQWPAVLSNPLLLDSDKRLLPMFITPYGSFQGSGNELVPIRNFAYFYITGWGGSGGGFKNPCEGHGDDPVPQGAGYVTGHFVKYVARINDGGAGDTACDFQAATPCAAVLTD